MSSLLPVLPVALPMLAGATLILLRERLVLSRIVAVAANISTLVAALMLVERVRTDGIQTLAFGGWSAPFGIVFVVDMLSALMCAVTMIVSTATLVFATCSLDERRERYFFYAFFQFLLMGVNGSFLTGDIFNLFVWFEVMLVSSYALMSLGGEAYQLNETFKYVVINAVSSTLFLFSVGLLYALTGTLNMADLVGKIGAIESPALVGVLAVLFMTVFATKAALFPVYMWLPRSYFAPPTVISGLFGGLLTKVGVYALFRVVTLWFWDVAFVGPVLLFVAGATMLFGVLGALSQWDMKRVLSYHIVSQIGYMIMGLGLLTPGGLAGGIFYMIHHILVKTSLFLVAGAIEKSRGTTHLKRLGGIIDTDPVLAALFFTAGLALAGAPPLSGFIAKLLLIDAGLESGAWLIVATSVVVSFLTLFSMMKIFRYAFWREEGAAYIASSGARTRLAAVGVLVTLSLALGLGAEVGFPYAELAAKQLLDPAGYVAAVLGPGVSP
ncbi:MAG: multicomponent Na+:H+ antiporter subunit D [Hyphomicrobiaceae bacterium]|jgi:multicomponent Na+:H+ antiporter subunit D